MRRTGYISVAGQRREYLPTLASFERGGDLMPIEAKSCSEAASMRTTVVLQGDESVTKVFITHNARRNYIATLTKDPP
jgi:hypothetical protein